MGQHHRKTVDVARFVLELVNEQLHKVLKDMAIPDLEQSKEKIEQQL